jgi:hypothetical protein
LSRNPLAPGLAQNHAEAGPDQVLIVGDQNAGFGVLCDVLGRGVHD